MNPKNILVTGSEGNIGTYVVSSLKKTYPGAHIVRIALGEGDPVHTTKDSLYYGDLRDPRFVTKVFAEQDIDYIIHLAARLYGVAGFNSDVHGLYSNDVLCLLNVLEHAKQVQKFVYFSSSMVYESSNEPPFKEELTDTLMPPQSSYGLTKFFGEHAVKFFNKQHGVPYTIWRIFNVVSPIEDHYRTGGHVFIDFYRKLFVEQGPTFEIYGSGQQVRTFSWVEEITEAIVRFLTVDATKNQTFNIGSTEAITMLGLKDLLLEIGKAQGGIPKTYNPKVVTLNKNFHVDVQLRSPNIDKISTVLGWRPTVSTRACFDKFVEYKLHHHT